MQDIFQENGLSLTKEQYNNFQKFLEIFKEKNSHVNLSSIRDDKGIIEKHFIDSLLLTKYIDLKNKKVIDVGTGGGFPGIPLKLYYGEDFDITFIDSVGKKVRAVEEFCNTLGLKNTHFIHGRGEDIAKVGFGERFDIVVTRAVAYLPDLLYFTLPLIKKGGVLIAYKLDNPDEREDAKRQLHVHHAKIEKVESYEIDEQKRCFLFIKKS